MLTRQKVLASTFVYLRFNCTTGDATGQNMVNYAAFSHCNRILNHFEEIRHYYPEGLCLHSSVTTVGTPMAGVNNNSSPPPPTRRQCLSPRARMFKCVGMLGWDALHGSNTGEKSLRFGHHSFFNCRNLRRSDRPSLRGNIRKYSDAMERVRYEDLRKSWPAAVPPANYRLLLRFPP